MVGSPLALRRKPTRTSGSVAWCSSSQARHSAGVSKKRTSTPPVWSGAMRRTALVSLVLTLLLAPTAAARTVDVPQLFATQLQRAHAQTPVPILLPTTMRSDFEHFHAEGRARPNAWRFDLGAVRGCNAGGACFIAEFRGVRGRSPSAPRTLRLARGRTGYYRPSKCGASCAPPAPPPGGARLLRPPQGGRFGRAPAAAGARAAHAVHDRGQGPAPRARAEGDPRHPQRPAMSGAPDAAFEELVAQHRRELHAHCYRMLGSVPDAEDALQDALLRAWRALPRFEGRSSVRAWLYRIATNACIDAANRRPKRVLPIDYGPASDAHDGPG